jgi:hypothetical protein
VVGGQFVSTSKADLHVGELSLAWSICCSKSPGLVLSALQAYLQLQLCPDASRFLLLAARASPSVRSPSLNSPSSAQFFLSGHIASLLHQTPPGPPPKAPKAPAKLYLHSCTNTHGISHHIPSGALRPNVPLVSVSVSSPFCLSPQHPQSGNVSRPAHPISFALSPGLSVTIVWPI